MDLTTTFNQAVVISVASSLNIITSGTMESNAEAPKTILRLLNATSRRVDRLT